VTVGKESPKERWDTHLALVLKHDVVFVRAFFKMAVKWRRKKRTQQDLNWLEFDPATQSPDGRVVSARISGRVECPPIYISRRWA